MILLAIPLVAGTAPPRGIVLSVPSGPTPGFSIPAPAPPPAPTFQPAPLPNRDMVGPSSPRTDREPSVAPSLFNRRDTYRGEGFSEGSSAQTEQDRRVKPGAGFNFRLPFKPQ